ncbi:MAG TPA: PaaI family thioesterase [Bryobacteraceae bacterium]|nr:PaaI family thioesterase [Bryobacteraceae bacterium]
MSRAIPTVVELSAWGKGFLPGLIGFEVVEVEPGRLRARMAIRPELLAPNGYLHAASIIGLADTACGYGTMADLPDQAKGFTTIELKSNFLGTALEGLLLCDATRPHLGRTTQVWDAIVTHEQTGKKLALFRCTQIVLY